MKTDSVRRRWLSWRLLAVVLIGLGLAWVYLANRAVQSPLERPFLKSEAPLVFAHRGASAYAPENTIAALRLALRQGADILEVDARMTKDGKVVLLHDASLLRTTGVDALVQDLTLAELQTIDAAYRIRRLPGGTVGAPHADAEATTTQADDVDDRAEYPFRGQGHVVPTLEELYREFPDVRVNVEIKHAEEPYMEAALFEVIDRMDREDDTLVVSGSGAALQRFREISGGRVATGASAGEALGFFFCALLNIVCRPEYAALQLPHQPLFGLNAADPSFLRHAERHGLAVHFWTVNDPERMRELLELQADGLMTDRPDLAAQAVRDFIDAERAEPR